MKVRERGESVPAESGRLRGQARGNAQRSLGQNATAFGIGGGGIAHGSGRVEILCLPAETELSSGDSKVKSPSMSWLNDRKSAALVMSTRSGRKCA
jgi:hypothetical protein